MSSIKIAGIMGSVVQLYSPVTNQEYLSGILEDFSEGHYLQGSLKVTVPYIVPYIVSFVSRRGVTKEYAP